MHSLVHDTLSHLHLKVTGVHPPSGFIGTLLLLIVILMTGTIFYSNFEGWGWLDSLYFSVMTITTVGYGDLHPTTTASKVFTIFYVFVGIGLGLYVITTFAESIVEGRQKRLDRLRELLKK
jgi:voltage-gated potassium channel Kch